VIAIVAANRGVSFTSAVREEIDEERRLRRRLLRAEEVLLNVTDDDLIALASEQVLSWSHSARSTSRSRRQPLPVNCLIVRRAGVAAIASSALRVGSARTARVDLGKGWGGLGCLDRKQLAGDARTFYAGRSQVVAVRDLRGPTSLDVFDQTIEPHQSGSDMGHSAEQTGGQRAPIMYTG